MGYGYLDFMNTATEQLTFDDVQIVPQYSEIESRSDVDTRSNFTKKFLVKLPLVAAPMATVCGPDMMSALRLLGAVGCLHRFMTIDEQYEALKKIGITYTHPLVASVGATGDYQERVEASLKAHANVILIDVAHGDHIHVKRAMEWLNKHPSRKYFDVIAGNIATGDAARRLEEWGADALRVGIGGGSACETRIRTGIGIPQLQAIINVADVATVPVIADGGIRTPSDVAKALAAGADTVMLGSMFAATNETPGEYETSMFGEKMKVFRGSASAEQKKLSGQETRNIEGTQRWLLLKGPVENEVNKIMDGVRSAMSYVGANNLTEFRQKAQFIRVTQAGTQEAHPHIDKYGAAIL
jgi:IMP dehydrogenase